MGVRLVVSVLLIVGWLSPRAAAQTAAGAPVDFDGDGRGDIALFKTSGVDVGTWYVLQGGTGYTTAFGLSFAGTTAADRPVLGDFDGDARTDIGMFKTGGIDAGTLYVVQGGTGFRSAFAITFAGTLGTDLPVPADFDGDGRTDFAVFRATPGLPDTGTLYVLQGGTNYTTAFSLFWPGTLATDTPVVADLDGDGRTDFGVFKSTAGLPDTGTVYVMQSGTAFRSAFSIFWAGTTATDTPVPGDYDGDLRTDWAIFKSTPGADAGTWYILQGGTGYRTAFSVTFAGTAPTDIPVPGFYDGDAREDIAIYRTAAGAPDEGTWYVLQGGSAYTTAFAMRFQGSLGTDKPLSRRVPQP